MIDFIAKCLTSFIPKKDIRRNVRGRIKTYFYARNIYKTAVCVGEGFRVASSNNIVSRNTYIGKHVRFNGVKISEGGKVTIGDYSQFGSGVEIIARNHNYDFGKEIPYDETYIHKDIEIGDFVWVGSHVVILPGTKIGEGAIIQAGAVVHGEIPPYAIVGGNPAKVFKYRDIEHFLELKEKKAFIKDIN